MEEKKIPHMWMYRSSTPLGPLPQLPLNQKSVNAGVMGTADHATLLWLFLLSCIRHLFPPLPTTLLPLPNRTPLPPTLLPLPNRMQLMLLCIRPCLGAG